MVRATIRTFEDADMWQKARSFANKVYEETLKGSFSKDYALKDQINKSAGSTMDNIAEGFERGGNKELINFLSYAKGSAGECRSQIYRAYDRNHLTEETFIALRQDVIEISKEIASFMRYLKQSSLKGSKFHEPLGKYASNESEGNDKPSDRNAV